MTYSSCLVKISKQPLVSIWLSILRNGMFTLEEKTPSVSVQDREEFNYQHWRVYIYTGVKINDAPGLAELG